MRRHTASSRASTKSIHEPAWSLHRFASLLSTFAAVAGVPRQTSRSIQPRELSGVPERSIPVSRFLRRSLRWTRRNFSSRAKLLSGGEVLILSAPKSGRTWIRTFLCAYLCKRHGLEFTLQPGRYDHPGFPRVIFSHGRFEHRTKGNRWDRLRGKYLVPRRELRQAKIVLLARDPRDCFVSLYLQMTRRDPSAD